MVFFTDEAGSWQVGVDWREALPATHTWSRVIGSLRNVEKAPRWKQACGTG